MHRVVAWAFKWQLPSQHVDLNSVPPQLCECGPNHLPSLEVAFTLLRSELVQMMSPSSSCSAIDGSALYQQVESPRRLQENEASEMT